MAADAVTAVETALILRRGLRWHSRRTARRAGTAADVSEIQRTAFTVTVDLAHGIITGISAANPAATIRAFADPATRGPTT